MKLFSRLSPYWLWGVLALPAFGFLSDAFTSIDPKVFHTLLHPTGEFGARLLIITMLATPLTLVHWARHDEFKGLVPALVHFGPLIALEAYRVWYWYLRPARRVAA